MDLTEFLTTIQETYPIEIQRVMVRQLDVDRYLALASSSPYWRSVCTSRSLWEGHFQQQVFDGIHPITNLEERFILNMAMRHPYQQQNIVRPSNNLVRWLPRISLERHNIMLQGWSRVVSRFTESLLRRYQFQINHLTIDTIISPNDASFYFVRLANMNIPEITFSRDIVVLNMDNFHIIHRNRWLTNLHIHSFNMIPHHQFQQPGMLV
ncbi:hypothetical protein BDA99DRAFT_541929 [Phascolomyces articulosus]|uniref:F-box domain-containing protein n=1 Tax=Phascolomyces articulosus TaxID=60185 RepID=A0AAD5K120_9FUNG|nr:hypothetical protein BDA99DRAFT_541929 [Phascolomyces articulosus]